jgi:WhiB family redox-sensing transcriptional regulator
VETLQAVSLSSRPEQVDLGAFEPTAWMHFAACLDVDPELFFPPRGGSGQAAKRICEGCTVRDECLRYALDTGAEFGIWAGLSAREVRELRRATA